MTAELNLTSRLLDMLQNEVQEMNGRVLELDEVDQSNPFTRSKSMQLRAEIRSLEIDIQHIISRNNPSNIEQQPCHLD
jgi:hypothetical protein